MNHELKTNLFKLYSKHNIKFQTLNEMFLETKINPEQPLLCAYCKKELELSHSQNELERMTLDHKLPKYWGGTDTVDNLVPACILCNTIKSTMLEQTYKEFLEALQKYGIKNKVFEELYPGQNQKKMLWELV